MSRLIGPVWVTLFVPAGTLLWQVGSGLTMAACNGWAG